MFESVRLCMYMSVYVRVDVCNLYMSIHSVCVCVIAYACTRRYVCNKKVSVRVCSRLYVCMYVCFCTLLPVPLCACVYANMFKTVSVYGTNIASTQTGCSIFTDIIAMAAGVKLFFLFFTWQNTESSSLPVLFRICPRLVCQKNEQFN